VPNKLDFVWVALGFAGCVRVILAAFPVQAWPWRGSERPRGLLMATANNNQAQSQKKIQKSPNFPFFFSFDRA
jgi:hypothetical protein